MNQWEVFVMDMSELAEGKDLALSIRTLNPGHHKYTYKHVRCQVSSNLDGHGRCGDLPGNPFDQSVGLDLISRPLVTRGAGRPGRSMQRSEHGDRLRGREQRGQVGHRVGRGPGRGGRGRGAGAVAPAPTLAE